VIFGVSWVYILNSNLSYDLLLHLLQAFLLFHTVMVVMCLPSITSLNYEQERL